MKRIPHCGNVGPGQLRNSRQLCQRTRFAARSLRIATAPQWAFTLALFCVQLPLCVGTANAEDNPIGTSVRIDTVDRENLAGVVSEWKPGQLVARDKQGNETAYPWTALRRIIFGNGDGLRGHWHGQDDQDVVQVGSPNQGNFIQDMHIQLSNLPQQRIVDLVVTGHFPKWTRVWRMNPAGTPHWRAAMERQHTGSGRLAHLYLEPGAEDAYDVRFDVDIRFEDGTRQQVQVIGETRTDDSLRVNETSDRGRRIAGISATILGRNGARLQGLVTQVNPSRADLHHPLVGAIQIPFPWIQTIARGSWSALHDYRHRPTDDQHRFWIRDRTGHLTSITGEFLTLDHERLRLKHEQQVRGVLSDRFVALTTSAAAGQAAVGQSVLELANGDRLTGELADWNSDRIAWQLAGVGTLQVPLRSIVQIVTGEVRTLFLSDLEPVNVQQTPYFDRILRFQRDHAWDGSALRLADKTYEKGLATHARTRLSYSVPAGFTRLRAHVGLADGVGPWAHVVCRVRSETGEVIWEREFGATDPAVELDLSTTGRRTLTLAVDFGRYEDIHDRVFWADARFVPDAAPSDAPP